MREQSVQPQASRGGRKRKPPTDLRSVLIGYRGTPAEQAELRASAGRAGMSVSQFMRAAKDAALRGTSFQPRLQTSHAPEIVAQLRQLGNNVNQIARHANFGTLPPEAGEEAQALLREISSYLRLLHYGSEH